MDQNPDEDMEHAVDVELVALVRDADRLATKSPGLSRRSVSASHPASPSRAHSVSNGSNLWRTFTNTFISFIGAGILGLPYAFSKVGIIGGTICLVTVAVMATYCMLLVVDARDAIAAKLPADEAALLSYGDLGMRAFGRFGKPIVNGCLLLSQAGFSTAYLIFIATNVQASFPGWSKNVIIAAVVPVLCVLAMVRHLKHLAFGSTIANVANITGLLVVFGSDVVVLNDSHSMAPRERASLGTLPLFLGVAAYCFEGVGMVLPLKQSMAEPKKFKGVLVGTLALVTFIYVFFGCTSYLAYGDNTQEIVTLNLSNPAFSNLVKFALCVGLYLTYPVMMVPVNNILERVLFGEAAITSNSVSFQLRSRLMRVGLVVGTAFVAASVPDFDLFLGLIGSTCCSALAFVIPAVINLRLREGLPATSKALSVCCIVIGLAAMVLGVHDSARELLHHYHAHAHEA